MLGVELGEEFEITNSIHEYKIDADGLKAVDSCSEVPFPATFMTLLRGDQEIVRRPWRPKMGADYWFVSIFPAEEYFVDDTFYNGCAADINRILMGNCFPTREAAEAATPEIVKFYKDARKMVEE